MSDYFEMRRKLDEQTAKFRAAEAEYAAEQMRMRLILDATLVMVQYHTASMCYLAFNPNICNPVTETPPASMTTHPAAGAGG